MREDISLICAAFGTLSLFAGFVAAVMDADSMAFVFVTLATPAGLASLILSEDV